MSHGDAGSEPPGGRGGEPPRLLQSWLEPAVRALLGLRQVSSERRAEVLASIQEGSQPTSIYYVLLGISELIAGFALIIDSDAQGIDYQFFDLVNQLLGHEAVPFICKVSGLTSIIPGSRFTVVRRFTAVDLEP